MAEGNSHFEFPCPTCGTVATLSVDTTAHEAEAQDAEADDSSSKVYWAQTMMGVELTSAEAEALAWFFDHWDNYYPARLVGFDLWESPERGTAVCRELADKGYLWRGRSKARNSTGQRQLLCYAIKPMLLSSDEQGIIDLKKAARQG
jgi:hypothetical protein